MISWNWKAKAKKVYCNWKRCTKWKHRRLPGYVYLKTPSCGDQMFIHRSGCFLYVNYPLVFFLASYIIKLIGSINLFFEKKYSFLNTTTMETTVERLISLLFDKEAEIKELNELLIQMNEKLQAIQNEYARLHKLYSNLKNKKVKVIERKIGYKTTGGSK